VVCRASDAPWTPVCELILPLEGEPWRVQAPCRSTQQPRGSSASGPGAGRGLFQINESSCLGLQLEVGGKFHSGHHSAA